MRKKEIEKASICQYQIIGTIGEQEAFKNGFVKGAEWADKTRIDNTWTVEDEFTPIDEVDWKVANFDRVGELWMNNCDGYMVLILPNGIILKSDI